MKKTLAILFCVLLVSCFALGALGEELTAQIDFELDDADNDKLASSYIQQALYPSIKRTARGFTSTANHLNEFDRAIYDELLPQIRLVSAGEEESTTFPISVDFFSANKLGIEDENDTNAIYSALRQHVITVCGCLFADYPAEVYWRGRSVGLGYAYYESNDKIVISALNVRILVSPEYQKENGNLTQYTVDSAKFGEAVTQALNNAQRIVAENEGLTDYYRLEAYKDAICDLTSYNFDAAGGSTGGGNPWQLIWALDDNPETTVVCEGYAKAFKYLNDLSSSSVPVFLASGDMYVGNEGGPHMWNIVRMDDGKNYLVDVTNCDGDGIGAPDRLFMAYNNGGNWQDGYSFPVNGGQYAYYNYDSSVLTEEELTISSEAYVQPIPKPEAPVYALSSETGLVGYSLAVRFDEAVEKAHERYSETLYDVEGNYLLIPLTEAGEISFSFAAEANGVLSEYGETLTVQVLAIDNNTVTIPADTEIIESEAFRGTDAEIVIVPTSVHTIGDYAFADMMNLKAVRLESPNTIVSDTAFDGSAEYVELAAENELDDYWFDVQRPFLVQ